MVSQKNRHTGGNRCPAAPQLSTKTRFRPGKDGAGPRAGHEKLEAVLAAECLAVQGDTVGTQDELAAFPALQRTLHLPGPIAGVNPTALAADLGAINDKSPDCG